VNDKAGYSPEPLTVVCGGELAVFGIVVHTRQFLPEPILTPPYGFSLGIDEYAVRRSTLNESFLLLVVSLDSRRTRLALRLLLTAREMIMHTPTRMRARRWMGLKEPLEVGPRLLR
jgi:hypothetical protein